jgi:MFS family permease
MRPGRQRFFGWWITAAVFLSFGITIGLPYYGTPFFYDYYHREFEWTRPEITLGLPLGALLTLWIGPVLVHRFRPRVMILIGSACTFVAFLGFGLMGGSLSLYYFLWIFYKAGAIFAGPIPYQVLISQWFRKRRGLAMGVAYMGVGVVGGISAKYIIQPLTERFGFQAALIGVGLLMFLTWPIALWVMKDRPSDVGQLPDGDPSALEAEGRDAEPMVFAEILRRPAFWLLLMGSCASIGAIGSINQHMKLVFFDYFQDAGLTAPAAQTALNDMFSTTLMCIMFSSVAGRLGMGYLADRFPKKWVMVVTYFLVAGAIPLLLRAEPPHAPYAFAVIFGLGLGADYMLIPLMAAELFGVRSLARTMAIIQPLDSFGQTMFPYLVAQLRQYFGSYVETLYAVFVLALVGAVAILLLPNPPRTGGGPPRGADVPTPVPESVAR